jgi:hypothetical protein
MALFEFEGIAERLSGNTGVGIGIAAAVLAPSLVPLIGRGLRPVAKRGIKACLLLTTRMRSAVAKVGQRLQDLYAEARSEVDAALAHADGATEAAG